MSNEATQHVKPPKVTPVAKLTIGKAIQPSLEGVRMFADINTTSGERTLNPQTSRVNREPLLRSQEKAKPRLDIEHVGCILVAVVESWERWDHSFCITRRLGQKALPLHTELDQIDKELHAAGVHICRGPSGCDK